MITISMVYGNDYGWRDRLAQEGPLCTYIYAPEMRMFMGKLPGTAPKWKGPEWERLLTMP